MPSDRACRDFRSKFPDDVLQENLAGQLWFGAEVNKLLVTNCFCFVLTQFILLFPLFSSAWQQDLAF